MRTRLCLISIVCALGCSPSRSGPSDDQPGPAAPDLAVKAPPPDLAAASPPGPLPYACGQYANYTAHTTGIVRSPCDYDVSRILSIGGDVKTRITPPTITMQFPDGTSFTGSSDGTNFTATRLTMFPYDDGCTWQATEVLQGTIDTHGNCTLRASYSYREAPISPPPCASPCTIDAQVEIDRVSIIID